MDVVKIVSIHVYSYSQSSTPFWHIHAVTKFEFHLVGVCWNLEWTRKVHHGKARWTPACTWMNSDCNCECISCV